MSGLISEDLAKMLELALPPDVRSQILALPDISDNVFNENDILAIEYYSTGDSTTNHKAIEKRQDYGDLWEEMYDIDQALEAGEVPPLRDNILGDQRPAKILNVIASVKLAEELDLDHIAVHSWNVEYNKKLFSGLVIQVDDPKATGVIYNTGRMIVTGARSEKDCRAAADSCIRTIRNAGCQINAGNSYRIQNVCATTDLGYRIRIDEMGKLMNDFKESCRIIDFSPEVFTGLVCNFENPRVTVVCFATGTLLFSGARGEEDIQVALFRFKALCFPFRH